MIYKSDEFIKILKHIANLPTTYYSGGNEWSKWNGNSWNFDCVVSIKSVLWGWNENKKAAHGGAKYKSNGVPDFTCDGGLDYCTDVSSDFRNIIPGEYLTMTGSDYEHVGIYLGDSKVFEVTTAWGVNGAVISELDANGGRWLDGVRCLVWTRHGKLKWIEYINPEPTPAKWNIGDYVTINGVYVSSYSTDELTPAVNHGKITRIIEARNPYLLNDGLIGWVNDGCITGRYDENSLLMLVKMTIRGDFGNGEERKARLGGRYDEVQRQVNLNYANGTTSWDNIRIY